MLLEPELHLQGDRVVLSHMYLNFYFETKFNEYINYKYSESAYKISYKIKLCLKQNYLKCQSLFRCRQRWALSDFPKNSIKNWLSPTN